MLFWLASAATLFAQPQDIRFEALSVEQGLSNFSVSDIIQDPQGFLWFGTEEGLNRYDGYDFVVYKSKRGDSTALPNSFIGQLFLDRASNLWINTSSALCRYNPDTDGFEQFAQYFAGAEALLHKAFYHVLEDRHGEFWLGSGDGLYRYHPKKQKLQFYHHDPQVANSLSANLIHMIFEDRAGAIWIATSEGGVNRYDRQSDAFQHFRHDPADSNSLSTDFVWCITEDHQGTIWIGTENGLNSYDPRTQRLSRFRLRATGKDPLAGERVFKLFVDSHGTLWAGTRYAGLWRYEPATERAYQYRYESDNPYALRGDRIHAIYEDRSGVLWIGHYRAGLSRYARRQDKFTRLKIADGVYAICQDRRGHLWVGAGSSGLRQFDHEGKLLAQYRHDPKNPYSLGNDNVMAICEDRHGKFWIGTGSGLNYFDPQQRRFQRYPHVARHPNNPEWREIKAVFEDASGEIWAGTKSVSLMRFDRRRKDFEYFDQITGVWAIAANGENGLWLATFGGGLNGYDQRTQTFTRYPRAPEAQQRMNSVLYSVYADAQGSVWTGSFGGGLQCYDSHTDSIRIFTDEDGLPDNFVKGILPDTHGNLWLSTDKGLARFDPAARKVKKFAVQDGLISNVLLSGAYFKNAEGRMFFGGEGGLVSFHPDSMRDNPIIPPVLLTRFKIFDQPQRLGPALFAIDKIPLSYSQNFFSFDFVALDYTAPAKNQYAYKLEGFDRDWIQAGTRRYASYTNVDPGAYVFRVKGSNSDGVWNEQGAAVRVVITPPFWKTWWFLGLVVLAICAALFGLYRYRVNRLVERTRLAAHLQAARETERTHLAREIHDELGQYLTGLKMDVAVMENLVAEQNREPARGLLLNKVHAMSNLLDTTVKTVRKISTELRPAVLDSLGLLAAIEWLAEEFQKRSGIACECYLTATEVQLERDRATAVFRIVQESLTNVLRHAKATRVTIAFEKEVDHYRLEVKDNGRGVQPQELRKRDSFGVLGMQERAHVFGGSVTLVGEPGKGTTLRVKIPFR